MDTQASPREAIRSDLESARTSFHVLLRSLSEEDWRCPSGNPGWTVGELLTHVLSYLTVVIPRGVAAARTGKRWGGFPPFIARTPVVHWLNRSGGRWLARRQRYDTIGTAYDQAHEAVLRLLESIQTDEWQKMTYTLGQTMTIEAIFRSHASHLLEHTPEIVRERR